MKLTAITQVSVDGVMQGNGGRHPGLDGGFERGGWARPLFGSQAMTLVSEVCQRGTVLSGDVAAAIGELKARPGGELQVHGSGSLVRWLLDSQLVDEITLLVCPVVAGQGTRLFPGTGPDTALDLVGSRAFPKGVTLRVYRPAGRPQYAAG